MEMTQTTVTMARISDERKNCANTSTPSKTPDQTALCLCRMRISSRTAKMGGKSINAASRRCPNGKLVSTNGEKP